MHAEDFGEHKHHRQAGLAGGRGAVSRHFVTVDVDHDLAHGEAVGRRPDRRLRHQRQGRRSVPHAQCRFEGGAAGGAMFIRLARQQGTEVLGMLVV
ncbi:hypothetical protein FQZ97_1204910 [compost metagenome]